MRKGSRRERGEIRKKMRGRRKRGMMGRGDDLVRPSLEGQ